MFSHAADFYPHCSPILSAGKKAQNVGVLVSGLLTGILGSRVVSGIVGEYWGWRTIFYIASILMLICIFVIIRILPDMPSNYKGTYGGLMKSVFTLVKTMRPYDWFHYGQASVLDVSLPYGHAWLSR